MCEIIPIILPSRRTSPNASSAVLRASSSREPKPSSRNSESTRVLLPDICDSPSASARLTINFSPPDKFSVGPDKALSLDTALLYLLSSASNLFLAFFELV